MQEQVTHIITTCVQHLGIPIESLTYTSLAGQHIYTVSTPESKRLIGPQGEHVRALNFIIRRYCERIPELREYKFLVDVNGYQVGHIHDIEHRAKQYAERARTTQSDVELPPMNSYERMIIHALFTNDPNIRTESLGERDTRRIVLKYESITTTH